MPSYLTNQHWESLPEPSIGDMIYLYYDITYPEYAKVVVTNVDSEMIVGFVEATYYRREGEVMPQCSDSVISGTNICFTRQMIQQIINL